jgi:D-alanyl-D-alanine carboxypeptidase
MKSLVLLSILFISSHWVIGQDLTNTCANGSPVNDPFTKENKLVPLLEELVNAGVPGVSLAVYSDEGWWEYSAGFAKIESKTKMASCHLNYLQSISKTYQATAILKLYEEGNIDLDQTIDAYLPKEYASMISRANEITVRMLLSHTSGIPEYNDHPVNITQLLQTPEIRLTTMDYLKVIDKKPLDFDPGTKYLYRNTNYLLLSLISDEITGDHAKHISEVIFNPLELDQTYYRNEDGYLNYPELNNAYWDRHSDGILENVTEMQRVNVSSLIGDDGIVSTPKDAVRFLKALLAGEIISLETLKIMKQGLVLKSGKMEYGLGQIMH